MLMNNSILILRCVYTLHKISDTSKSLSLGCFLYAKSDFCEQDMIYVTLFFHQYTVSLTVPSWSLRVFSLNLLKYCELDYVALSGQRSLTVPTDSNLFQKVAEIRFFVNCMCRGTMQN